MERPFQLEYFSSSSIYVITFLLHNPVAHLLVGMISSLQFHSTDIALISITVNIQYSKHESPECQVARLNDCQHALWPRPHDSNASLGLQAL